MHIAINTLGTSSLKAGVGNYVVNLVRELGKINKLNQYYIILNSKNKGLYKETSNTKILEAPTYTKNKYLRALWEHTFLGRTLRNNKIDLLHSPGFVVPSNISGRIKKVITIHDMTFFTHPQYHEKKKVLYYTRTIPKSIKQADGISADSESTRKDLIKLFPETKDKTKTIHLGTDIKPVQKKKAKKYVSEKYGLNKPFLLFVGTLEPRKNVAGLLDAFAGFKQDYDLLIAGQKGWMYQEIFDKVKQLKIERNVHFLGYVEDKELPLLYSSAECFVYPSFYEGFGLPVLEAMACGCPVVTSNNSSMKEIAEDAAYLIEPTNVKEIVAGINNVVSNDKLKEKMTKKGLERAKQFTWKKCAEKTRKLYEDAAK